MALTAAMGTLALNSLRSIYDIAKDIRNSNDTEKLRVAADQMFDLALQAREQVWELQNERNSAVNDLAALRAEIEKSKSFAADKENYNRETTRTGAVVYREKGAGGDQGKSPYLCPHCFANEKISMMQPGRGANTMLGKFVYECPACQMATELYALRQ